MARPVKRGVDYFPLDVSFFCDRRIKSLKGKYGSDGIAAYIYLLCTVYSENGYYIKVDEYFHEEVADDLNITVSKATEMLKFMCKRSLFDEELFNSERILTSRGIQRRFQEAVRARASKNAVKAEPKYWLLEESETNDYIRVFDSEDCSRKNSGNSENNPSYSEKKYTKENKEKKKESKLKEEEKEEEKADIAKLGGDAHDDFASLDGTSKTSSAASALSHIDSVCVDSSCADSDFEACVNAYKKYIGAVTPAVTSGIKGYLKKGTERALIVRLIEYANEQNKTSWQYIETALRGNFDDGIKTLTAYNKTQEKRRESKPSSAPSGRQSACYRSKFNNYTDTNPINLTADDILREILEE